MALINRSIPNLYQGVSQQSASMRLPTQCEEQINAFSSIVEGLKKRPPTKHLAKLSDNSHLDVFVHIINRDIAERYIVIIANGTLKVFDFQGNKKTVKFPKGKAYLTHAVPREGFSAVTVADYTFIVNKSVKALMDKSKFSYDVVNDVVVTSVTKVAPKTVTGITVTNTSSLFGSTTYKVTFTTETAHGHSVGDLITVAGTTQDQLDGDHKLTDVTEFTFSYEIDTFDGNLEATFQGSYQPQIGLATFASVHGLVVGDKIRIYGANETEFNNETKVASVPSTTTFTYPLSKGGTTGTATGDVKLSRVMVKGSKSRFTELPTKDSTKPAPDNPPTVGDIWEITGTDTNQFDQYYVKWDGDVWRETLKPGILTSFDAATMPHQLKRNSDGTFTFEPAEWNPRIVGDDDSNKIPSFVDRTINDVFFHRNRLGVCADENVIFSRAGDFFNFWSETITAVLDSDPIDVAVNHNKVSVVRYAVPFNTSLMIFSDQVQFQLSARDLLTPKTVNINATTEFEMNPQCKPVANGQDLYFAVNKGAYTAIKEYYVQPLTYTNDASEITSHVPKYIPQGVFKIISSSTDDLLFVLNTTTRNQVHVYKFYWGAENEKVQSSWSQWTFNEGDVILNGDTINNYLYLIIQRSDGVYLEVLNFQAGLLEDDLPVLVHLDRKVKISGTYDEPSNTTTWTLPYPYNNVQGVLGGSYGFNAGTELKLTPSTTDSTKVSARGNYTSSPVYFGVPYTMRYLLSEIYFKDLNDKSPVTHYQLQLKNMDVLYSKTGYLRVEVTPKMRQTYKYIYSGLSVGTSSLGSINLLEGKLRAPVYSSTRDLKIEFINDTYLPCALQSAEWEAVLSTLSRRI